MKKIIKNNIFGFIIGGVLFSTVGVSATIYLYYSDQVSYNNENTTATDVKAALDNLYELTSVGDATAADIATGKTALVHGKQIMGTMINDKNTIIDNTLKTETKSASYVVPGQYSTTSVSITYPNFTKIIGVINFSWNVGNSAIRYISFNGNIITLTIYNGYTGGGTTTFSATVIGY